MNSPIRTTTALNQIDSRSTSPSLTQSLSPSRSTTPSFLPKTPFVGSHEMSPSFSSSSSSSSARLSLGMDRGMSVRSDASGQREGKSTNGMISLSTLLEEDVPAPPASLLDIIKRFNVEGNGDRALLLAILAAKQAEDERLSRILETRLTLFQMHATRTGLVLPNSPPTSSSDVTPFGSSGLASGPGRSSDGLHPHLHRDFPRGRGGASPRFPSSTSASGSMSPPHEADNGRITLPPIFASSRTHASPAGHGIDRSLPSIPNLQPLPARSSYEEYSCANAGPQRERPVLSRGQGSSRSVSSSSRSSHGGQYAERMISPIRSSGSASGGERSHPAEDGGRLRSLSNVAARALEDERKEREVESARVGVTAAKRKANSVDGTSTEAARETKKARATVALPAKHQSNSPPVNVERPSGLEMLLDAAAARGMGKGEMLFI